MYGAAFKPLALGTSVDLGLRLGLSADDSFEDNVRHYIEDDRP